MRLLEAHGLAKAFGGVRAVDGVSLAVDAGEIVALIGPNGAGKSTTFALLDGQLAPDAGRVLLDGKDVAGVPPSDPRRRAVGRTFQVAATFASMTVRENVQTALVARQGRIRSFGRPLRQRGRVEALGLLARVGMAEAAETACGTLAYGDLKRVELALALAGTPRLLLMDEPTAGMAPAERRQLMALVARIAREDGLGVLFTEHDMDVVFGHAGRVLVMDRGRLVAEGPPEAVRADPLVHAVYLGEDEP